MADDDPLAEISKFSDSCDMFPLKHKRDRGTERRKGSYGVRVRARERKRAET